MNDNEFSVAWLRRSPKTAERVTEILGLPNLCWTEVRLSFGTEDAAVARVTLFVTAEQLTQLAMLAAERP